MQHPQTVEPRRVGGVEVATGTSVGEHRPFAELIDEDDDRAGTAVPTHGEVDAVRRHRFEQGRTDRVVAHLSDEPCRHAEARHGDRHVRSAATTTPVDVRLCIGRHVDRTRQSDHDVLHQITERSDHAQQATDPEQRAASQGDTCNIEHR